MFRFCRRIFFAAALWSLGAALFSPSSAERLGLGRAPTAEEVAAWDIDVRFDGAGLPSGSGDAATGEVLYDTQCAACHGDFGQGEGRWPALSGGEHSLTLQGAAGRPEKTVGSYWPHAPTLFDYIRRAMPYTRPQSLSDDDAYALAAYVLYLNDIVGDDFVASAKTLPQVEMPNRDNFYMDPRPDSQNVACVSDCLNAAEVDLLESITGVTPEQEVRRGEPAPAGGGSKGEEGEGAALYGRACAVCHAAGVAEAPVADSSGADDWKRRLDAVGLAGMVESSLNGKGAMPPQSAAGSPEEIEDAVRHMLRAAGIEVED